MKPRLITSILLFISAYSPLFLILAVKDFDFGCTKNFKHPIGIWIMLGITVLSVVLLFAIFKKFKRGNMVVRITEVKDRSVDLINYTIPYILSFFGFDLSKPEDVISLTIFLLIMLLLTIRSKAVFLNPILALVGYSLYDIEYEFDGKKKDSIVLSKHEPKGGEVFYVKALTRFLYLTMKRKN